MILSAEQSFVQRRERDIDVLWAEVHILHLMLPFSLVGSNSNYALIVHQHQIVSLGFHPLPFRERAGMRVSVSEPSPLTLTFSPSIRRA